MTFTECEGESCGGTYSDDRYGGTCDPNGCDFNAYRVGVTDFYGEGMTVDTSQPLTVVTQFSTANGGLEISRLYVQNGEVIENPEPTIEGMTGNTLTQEWCDTQQTVFAEPEYPFNDHGGMDSMVEAMEAGMVLVMSLWGDEYAHMLWLDSNYPVEGDPSTPGVARGTCPTDSGDPDDLVADVPGASVVFSNIKFGPIGSTYESGAAAKQRREAEAEEMAKMVQ